MSIKEAEFLELARWFGQHGTCSRLRVGSILVMDRRIISTGYNGAPAGLPHCTHDDLEPCERAVHAEANVIAFAAKSGVRTQGTVLYTTHAPCVPCSQLIINAGIVKVVYGETYRRTEGQELLEEAGIPVNQVDGPTMRPLQVKWGDGSGLHPSESGPEESER